MQIIANNKKAFFRRGDAKYNLYDYKGALEDYSKAIELDPKDKESLVRRARAN